MAGRLDGKVALISGAARGIGAAAATRFVEEGARVVVGDILEEDGKRTADALGEAARFVRLDVTSLDDWQAAVAFTEREFGSLTTLVNNAGILQFGSIQNETEDSFRRTLDVNVVGVWLGMKAALPALQRAGADAGCSIVNSSSVEGMGGMPYLTGYGASKFAVRGMSKGAALEFAKDGIRVNSIHPGAIRTPMVIDANVNAGGEADQVDFIGQMVPLKRMGEPQDVANLMLFLASDESGYATGAEFVVDGGATSTSGFGH